MEADTADQEESALCHADLLSDLINVLLLSVLEAAHIASLFTNNSTLKDCMRRGSSYHMTKAAS
jgi:hypothetical protein